MEKLRRDVREFVHEIEKNGIRQLIENVASGVVLITTISNSAEDDGRFYNSAVKNREKKHHYKYGVTSGVLISEDGVVVTTCKGIMNSDKIIVSLDSEKKNWKNDGKIHIGNDDYKAEIIKSIPELNLAFLKISPKSGVKLTHIKLGNDASLINGHKILKNEAAVIGKAKGENYVTFVKPANSSYKFGIAANGIEEMTYKKIKGKAVLLMRNHITGGIIAEYNGGAVIGSDGKLLGLVSYDVSGDFQCTEQNAIPVSIVKRGCRIAVPGLITPHMELGIDVVDLEEPISPSLMKVVVGAERLECIGVSVKSVELKSIADEAGIQAGDKILKLDSDVVQDAETFHNLINATIGKQNICLTILRGNKLIDLEIST
jgi:S1-C subfamily serine protease